MADHDDKTLDPTPHRRQQAREQGQFARSHDLNAAGLLLGGVAALLVSGRQLLDFLARLTIDHLSGKAWLDGLHSAQGDASSALMERWNTLMLALATALVPLLAVALGASLAVQLAQSGPMFRPAQAAPDFARVSPLVGLRRLWSAGSLARLAFGLLKMAAVAGIAFWCLRDRGGELASISALSVGEIAHYAWETCLWTCAKIALGLAALAVLDYARGAVAVRARSEDDAARTARRDAHLARRSAVAGPPPRPGAAAQRQAGPAAYAPGSPGRVTRRLRATLTTWLRPPGNSRTCACTCPSGGRSPPAGRRESGRCPGGIPGAL